VPSQQRRRLDSEGRPTGSWQHAGQHGEQSPVGVVEAWRSSLTAEHGELMAQHGELMAQHHDLHVLGLDGSEAQDDKLQPAANSPVQEAKAMA
jgi:hypothetical protein